VNHLSHWDHHNSEAAIDEMSRASERECLPRLVERTMPHWPPRGFARPGGRPAGSGGGGDGESEGGSGNGDGGWSSVVLVPFWGGTAEASGGNAHSKAKREVKVRQAAGTVCSAVRAFGRAAVGVCNAADRDSVLASLGRGGWGLGPAVAIQLAPVAFRRSMAIRDEGILNTNLKHLKLDYLRLTRDEKAALLEATPGTAAKLHNLFDLKDAVVTNGTAAEAARARLLVVQFDCAVGVHLPFHLLQFAQALLRNGRGLGGGGGGSNVAATATSGSTAKAKLRAEAADASSLLMERGDVRGVFGGGGATEAARGWGGPLEGLSWGDVEYIYFTEADQLTFVRSPSVLAALVSMLNGTSYVSPQRTTKRGRMVLNHPRLSAMAENEVVQASWATPPSPSGQWFTGQSGARRDHRRRRLRSGASGRASVNGARGRGSGGGGRNGRRHLLSGETHAVARNASSATQRARAVDDDGGASLEPVAEPSARRRLRLPHTGEKAGAASANAAEALALENECLPDQGEPGYLGPAQVHVARPPCRRCAERHLEAT